MKNSKLLKCSAILCVRDEEKRILQGLTNLQRLPVDEVIVVDGDSRDATVEMLQNFEGLTIIQGGNGGLLAQRIAGIHKARNEILLLIDVDDNITPSDLTEAYRELSCNASLDGLQFSVQSAGNSWFARAWSNYLSITYPTGALIPMLGRPCLTYRHHYANLVAPNDNILSDDLWLRFNMVGESKKFVTTGSKTVRDFPVTLRQNLSKFIDYGVSDYRIVNSKAQRAELLAHSFWRIAILRTFASMRPKTWRYSLFPVMLGLLRGSSHLLQIAIMRQRPQP